MMGRQMEKICKEFREEGRTEVLVELVRSGRITAIEAAEVLGVSVESFMELMADNA